MAGHLTLEECDCLAQCLYKGLEQQQSAKNLRGFKSAISRELKPNGRDRRQGVNDDSSHVQADRIGASAYDSRRSAATRASACFCNGGLTRLDLPQGLGLAGRRGGGGHGANPTLRVVGNVDRISTQILC
jgi:hypothetical protein